MLVLSRKVGQEIVIAEHICVRVLAIKGNQVRLGIEAPSDVGIVRSELIVTLPPEDSGETINDAA